MSIEGDLGQIIIEDNIKKEKDWTPHSYGEAMCYYNKQDEPAPEPFYILSYSNKEGKWLKYV